MTGQCIRVLIIEDNPGDARLVQETLKGNSDPAYRLEWVDRLSSGLARLSDGGIDVLLLDLGLPDSRGLETLSRIQALAPTVPVVVLSGAEDEQLAVEAVRQGSQDYLVKAHANQHLLTRSLRYAIQRKQAAEALRASEERLRLAVAAANEAIWEYDPVHRLRWNMTYDEPSGSPPEMASPRRAQASGPPSPFRARASASVKSRTRSSEPSPAAGADDETRATAHDPTASRTRKNAFPDAETSARRARAAPGL